MWKVLRTFLLGLLAGGLAFGQGATVTVHLRFAGDGAVRGSTSGPTVMWLSPLQDSAVPLRATRVYSIVQRNKRFVPHLLVVPVGTTVTFPNEDPFFHNVFSLFNGKRFDLGLYQAGQSQQVKVQWEGVSYIFCNIHPEMGGVIVSLATPFYAVSDRSEVVVRAVPPGTYKLNLWNESATQESLRAATRTVTVAGSEADLGEVVLVSDPRPSTHMNKFGQPYTHVVP